jgi:L-threonylcarbamoyladenylate synthase
VRAFRVTANKTSGKSITTAISVLQAGGIVAFPTETVYGLCVDPANADAVARLYALKGRDGVKASAHLISDRKQASVLADGLPPPAARLAHAFWPGPLTLVVPAARGGTIGLRLSSVALARALVRGVGRPLLQTSANRSGEPAALNASGVFRSFGEGVDLILDAGRVTGGTSSTVVECQGPTFHVVRESAISAAEIEAIAVERIVIACTGNICRSPLAEEILRTELAKRLAMTTQEMSERAFSISSCGTQGWEDSPAAAESVRSAQELGYDLGAHRGAVCTPELMGNAHRVWVMSEAHLDDLRLHFQDRPGVLALFNPAGDSVEDPYKKSRRVFRRIAKEIQALARLRAAELVPIKR